MTDNSSAAQQDGQQRPDPTETAPAEGESRSIPAQDQGKDQGTDTAYDAPPAEGARDED
jgi:hypothetical protein